MRDLLHELVHCLDQKRDCVYCSVVETRGSTPQKAGAAMLVYADGKQFGTLGGGCIEAEVKQRALRVLNQEQGHCDLLTFNLDDNYGWDDGLICGGRMAILADPILSKSSSLIGSRPGISPSTTQEKIEAYYRQYHEVVEAGRGCTEAVVIADKLAGASVGNRYLFAGDGSLVAQLGDERPSSAVRENLTPLDQRPRPSVRQGVSYLPVLPRITLLIVGGGHVGQAVAQLAASVDFEVWVVDDREKYVNQDRFPMARRIIIGDIGDTLKQMASSIHQAMYCIVVTRGHSHDEEALYHLANTRAGYVGMIGSKRKIKLIFEDLVAKDIPEKALERVHAPLGFDIGSQTVPEIAVSIVAELIAHRNLPHRES